MADMREHLRQAAPPVPDLDVAALRCRAASVRTADQRRQRLTFGGLAGILVLVVALAASPLVPGEGMRGAEVAVGQATSPLAGIRGPSVLGEGDLSLADFAGQALLVYIWGDWCGRCVDEGGLYSMGRIALDGDDDVTVVGIVTETSREQAAQAMAETQADFPTMILEDPDALVPAILDREAYEGLVVSDRLQGAIAIDATGAVRDLVFGTIPEHRGRMVADNARSGTNPSPAPTVALDPAAAEPATEFPMITVTPEPPPDGAYPNLFPSPNPYPDQGIGTYVVQEGDTLSLIAETVYGDPLAFGLIAEANELGHENPIQVGMALTIPSNPNPNPNPGPGTQASGSGQVSAGNQLAAVFDPDVAAAIRDTAPSRWTPRPSSNAHSEEWENPQHWIRFTSITPTEGRTAADEVGATIDAGDEPYDLPDGTPGSFRNPPSTGRVLIALPGNRLLEIASGDPSATPIDYAMPDLFVWIADIRAALE